jgi:entericidin B
MRGGGRFRGSNHFRSRPMTRLIVLLALLGVTACETIEGAGQDLENTGEAISEEAREVQAGM